jgi:hypothetical protein
MWTDLVRMMPLSAHHDLERAVKVPIVLSLRSRSRRQVFGLISRNQTWSW